MRAGDARQQRGCTCGSRPLRLGPAADRSESETSIDPAPAPAGRCRPTRARAHTHTHTSIEGRGRQARPSGSRPSPGRSRAASAPSSCATRTYATAPSPPRTPSCPSSCRPGPRHRRRRDRWPGPPSATCETPGLGGAARADIVRSPAGPPSRPSRHAARPGARAR